MHECYIKCILRISVGIILAETKSESLREKNIQSEKGEILEKEKDGCFKNEICCKVMADTSGMVHTL